MASRPTICLNMIVKNEAHVIERCLASVKPFIDSWAIVDTGSTDGTQKRIQALLPDVPGELVDRPWRDFAHNRNEALALARDRAEYVFFIDADEELLLPEGSHLGTFVADAIQILQDSPPSGVSFYSAKLVRATLPWRWHGVIHEYLSCSTPHTVEKLRGPTLRGHFDSARNTDRKRKYVADADVLKAALEKEPDNARYAFYLGQCYRSADLFEEAEQAYERRIAMGGSREEVGYSLYQLGLVRLKLGRPWSEVRDTLLRAAAHCPDRAEPLWVLAVCSRQAERHDMALEYAKRAITYTEPDDALFVEREVYTWRVLEEYALAAFELGWFDEALQANRRLLERRGLPAAERARIEANEALCDERVSFLRAQRAEAWVHAVRGGAQ